ncbi:MAG: hypothetical protein F4008_11170 [Gammaproteobacteria bacterium]|nr:hypothetical protein [Gammaproteobacteria bacterium]MYL14303.1 hypothetical protein [Gammaproteobacteria bacterium]
MNHLEQLVSEWYEYRGYFVRRNVNVGAREKGGYECELDIIAYHPGNRNLVQIEASMDAHTWERREQRFRKKFEAGKKYIPQLFFGIEIPNEIVQIPLLGFGSNKNVKKLAGHTIVTVSDLLVEITSELSNKKISKAAVPEQFPLLRTIQFVCEHRHAIGWSI